MGAERRHGARLIHRSVARRLKFQSQTCPIPEPPPTSRGVAEWGAVAIGGVLITTTRGLRRASPALGRVVTACGSRGSGPHVPFHGL